MLPQCFRRVLLWSLDPRTDAERRRSGCRTCQMFRQSRPSPARNEFGIVFAEKAGHTAHPRKASGDVR